MPSAPAPIKVELHAHTDEDPADRISHSAKDLIDRAAACGYGALAITLHNRWSDPAPLRDYAGERGITLIPAIERNIGRKHVLLINTTRDAERVETFEGLAALKAATGTLVVAPHAFYPIPSALGAVLDEHPDLFDALEVNSMHVRGLDFNRPAIRWAQAHGKPLVGNTDLHLLTQLGTTYSLVEAETRTADAICQAIRDRRVVAVSEPLGWVRAAVLFTRMTLGGLGSGGRRQSQTGDQTSE
jgi:predicted metal-dependent phosphoesterase TrpH